MTLNNNTNTNIAASTEDLTEAKQRSTIPVQSSSLLLSKNRYNSEDAPLNYDDTDPESDDNDDDDDDDDFKQSKSSEDKRIFVKELNYVKGRQVGLLIGPFGRSILIPLFLYNHIFRSTYHTNSRTNWCENSFNK
jgi:hypothetical protein